MDATTPCTEGGTGFEVVVVGAGASAALAAARLAGARVSAAVVGDAGTNATFGSGELFSLPAATPAGGEEELPAAVSGESGFIENLLEVFQSYSIKPNEYLNINGDYCRALLVPEGSVAPAAMPRTGVMLVSLPGIFENPVETVLLDALKARGVEARCGHVRLQADISDFSVAPARWAARMDDERQREEIVSRIAFQLGGNGAAAYVFPPILGIARRAACREALGRKLGAEALELLGAPGWPPGLRLAAGIDAALSRLPGVRRVRDRVAAVELDRDGRVAAVVTRGGERIAGKRFLLATGGLSSGGLVFEERLREPLFDLPVFTREGEAPGPLRGERLPPEAFWAPRIDDNGPLFSAGVKVDGQMRPLGRPPCGAPANLFACGSVLFRGEGERGARPIDPGRSALSGWKAAGAILQEIASAST